MITTTDGAKPVSYQHLGLYSGDILCPVESLPRNPILRWNGARMPSDLWRQCLAFMKWTYDEYSCEAQLRWFYKCGVPDPSKLVGIDTKGQWQAVVLPQDIIAGLSARELLNNRERDDILDAVGADWAQVGTLHHHCGSGAFMSGTDEHDERRQNGLHVTVGTLNAQRASFHARTTFRGVLYRNVEIEDWFEDYSGNQLDLGNTLPDFPEEWKGRLQKQITPAVRHTTHYPNHPHGMSYGQGNAMGFSPTVIETAHGVTHHKGWDRRGWGGNTPTTPPHPLSAATTPASNAAASALKTKAQKKAERKAAKQAAKAMANAKLGPGAQRVELSDLFNLTPRELEKLSPAELLGVRELAFRLYKEKAPTHFKGGHTSDQFATTLLDSDPELVSEANSIVFGADDGYDEVLMPALEAVIAATSDTTLMLRDVLFDMYRLVSIAEMMDPQHTCIDCHSTAVQLKTLVYFAQNADAIGELYELFESLQAAEDKRLIDAEEEEQAALDRMFEDRSNRYELYTPDDFAYATQEDDADDVESGDYIQNSYEGPAGSESVVVDSDDDLDASERQPYLGDTFRDESSPPATKAEHITALEVWCEENGVDPVTFRAVSHADTADFGG
jgi:hypothetical protein